VETRERVKKVCCLIYMERGYSYIRLRVDVGCRGCEGRGRRVVCTDGAGDGQADSDGTGGLEPARRWMQLMAPVRARGAKVEVDMQHRHKKVKENIRAEKKQSCTICKGEILQWIQKWVQCFSTFLLFYFSGCLI